MKRGQENRVGRMPDRTGPPEVDRMQYNAGLLGNRGDGELCRKQGGWWATEQAEGWWVTYLDNGLHSVTSLSVALLLWRMGLLQTTSCSKPFNTSLYISMTIQNIYIITN